MASFQIPVLLEVEFPTLMGVPELPKRSCLVRTSLVSVAEPVSKVKIRGEGGGRRKIIDRGVGGGALEHEECFGHFGWEFLIPLGQNDFLGAWAAGGQVFSSLRPGLTLLGHLCPGESS